MNLRITYDRPTDAAYIYLAEPNDRKGQGRIYTFEATTPEEVQSFVALDWQDGRIVGIEVLDASERLHPDLLAAADHLG